MFVVVYPDDQRARAGRLYYAQHPDIGQDAPVPVAEPRDGWIPRPLPGQYNPRPAQQLLYRQQWAQDVQTQSATFEPRDTPPRQLQQQYRPRPQLVIWHENHDIQFQPAGGTAEPRDGWSPRPLSGTRLLVRRELVYQARALDVPPVAASGAARSVGPQWLRRLELLHLRGWGGLGS